MHKITFKSSLKLFHSFFISSKYDKFWIGLALLIALLFFVGSTLISLVRFWQFDAHYYDLGIFDVALWKVAHFQAPIIDHFSAAGGKWIFADHFHPAIFVLSPLYWIFKQTEVILVAQALIVTLSGLVLFQIARKLLQYPVMGVSVLSTYFLYAGLQHALWWDFHEVTILTLPMTLLFYFFLTKNYKLHFFFFIFCLLFKETLFAFGIGWAIFVFFYRKEWRKTALVLLLISVGWFFLTTQALIPFFRGEAYYYQLEQTASMSPQEWLISIFTPWEKEKFLLLSALSFGLTIILVPELWGVVGLHYLLRFLSPSPQRYSLGLHYNAEIAPIYALAMILALIRIQKWSKNKNVAEYLPVWISISIAGLSLFLYQFVTLGPFRLAYIPDFYTHTTNFTYLHTLKAQIPSEATVMAQSNLASHLTHQPQLWILRDTYEEYQPEYLFLDIREGQNPNNWAGIPDIKKLYSKIAADEKYELVAQEATAYLFKRK